MSLPRPPTPTPTSPRRSTTDWIEKLESLLYLEAVMTSSFRLPAQASLFLKDRSDWEPGHRSHPGPRFPGMRKQWRRTSVSLFLYFLPLYLRLVCSPWLQSAPCCLISQVETNDYKYLRSGKTEGPWIIQSEPDKRETTARTLQTLTADGDAPSSRGSTQKKMTHSVWRGRQQEQSDVGMKRESRSDCHTCSVNPNP